MNCAILATDGKLIRCAFCNAIVRSSTEAERHDRCVVVGKPLVTNIDPEKAALEPYDEAIHGGTRPPDLMAQAALSKCGEHEFWQAPDSCTRCGWTR